MWQRKPGADILCELSAAPLRWPAYADPKRATPVRELGRRTGLPPIQGQGRAFAQAEARQSGVPVWASVSRLWSGQVALSRAFWLHMMLFGTLVNIYAVIGFLAVLTLQLHPALVILASMVPIPYNVFLLIAVWRSAGRCGSASVWGAMARPAALTWCVVMSII
jgi:hypothetical protein